MSEHGCPNTDDPKDRYEHVALLLVNQMRQHEERIVAIIEALHPTYTLEDYARGILAFRLDMYMSTKGAVETGIPHIDVDKFEAILMDDFVKGIETRGIKVPSCYYRHR